MSLRDLVQSSFDTIEKLHAAQGAGHRRADRLHRSRRDDVAACSRRDLVIVAARPSMGKTSLVLNIAQHVGTKTDMTVGFFSLEMSKEQLFMRMLTSEARIDAHRLPQRLPRRARLRAGCRRRSARSSEAKIFIDDTPSIGVLEMRAKARRLAGRARPATCSSSTTSS